MLFHEIKNDKLFYLPCLFVNTDCVDVLKPHINKTFIERAAKLFHKTIYVNSFSLNL